MEVTRENIFLSFLLPPLERTNIVELERKKEKALVVFKFKYTLGIDSKETFLFLHFLQGEKERL